MTDVLPPGVEATSEDIQSEKGGSCSGTTVVKCELPEGSLPYDEEGKEARALNIRITVSVEPNVPEGPGPADRVTVSGGGAEVTTSSTAPVTFAFGKPDLGFANVDAWTTNADGTVDTQAGSHPYEFTLAFALNREFNEHHEEVAAGGETRDLEVEAPPGLIGNPDAVPRCTAKEFDESEGGSEGGCPAGSDIGEDFAEASDALPGGPVYNMVPPAGDAAQFAFDLAGTPTYLDAYVRSGGDYGITERTNNIYEHKFVGNTIVLWGVPGEHNGSGNITPFLTLPTSCQGPQEFSAEIRGTWQNENATARDSFLTHDEHGTPTGYTGCNKLVHFEPKISIAPDTSYSDTPAGLTATVKVPQGVNPEGLATSSLKETTVTLPQGVAINPGQATGLAACQSGKGLGTDDLPNPGENGEAGEWDGPPECPSASKVGTDEISTPVLPNRLKGNVYVLQSNPPELKLLVAASGEGVNLKLVGTVHLNEQTGQLTTTFKGTPQHPGTPDAPLNEFVLSFSGGAQAALVTPPRCGVYTSNADFSPWAGLENGVQVLEDALQESRFQIDSGPDGSPCTPAGSPLPFSPTLTAGATTDQAGGYTDFSMLLQRPDGQQRIAGLQFKAPEGLSGMLSTVPLCGEQQANEGTCPAGSQIGHAVVGAGPGPYPFYIPQNGAPPAPIYLTGPYDGAPFGLSIVTPVIAGPFNLGTNVVRAKIEVDPHTAQISVTTDTSGPHSVPTILDGIPTDVRVIDAVIERPGFMFNPTNCNPQEFNGTATSAEGAKASLNSHFQVGSCQALKFSPKFSVSTSAKSSKAAGAQLTLKVSRESGPASQQANFAKVKVDLPKQLPSRLTTLQKACTAAQFEANPAGCPVASVVGHARVFTPELPVPLEGPAYFVSHGGEAFPSLTFVLQGDNVTLDVVSTTFISKSGITSATLNNVPDAPFTSFELTLPQGKYSALTSNLPVKDDYSFCGQKLAMPTAFVAQNGLEIHQSTAVTITGCAKKTALLTRAQKLAKALKACKQDKQKAKRASCVRAAHARYGPPKKSKSSKRKG